MVIRSTLHFKTLSFTLGRRPISHGNAPPIVTPNKVVATGKSLHLREHFDPNYGLRTTRAPSPILACSGLVIAILAMSFVTLRLFNMVFALKLYG